MKSVLRNILAVIVGLVAGGTLNMALVTLGARLVTPPPGVNMADAQSLASSAHLLEPKHFVFPFLAHALGTLAGALIAFLIAARRPGAMAYVIGSVFLLGGIAASRMIPAPTWFIVLDLAGAYLPMAWLGIQLGRCFRRGAAGSAAAPAAVRRE